MSKFKSILDHIGHALVDVFKVGTTVAAIAQPFIATAFPQVAPLYTSALNEAIQVQALATAAAGIALPRRALTTTAVAMRNRDRVMGRVPTLGSGPLRAAGPTRVSTPAASGPPPAPCP